MEKQLLTLSALLAQNTIGKAAQEVATVAKFPLETCHLMALCHASWAVGMNYSVKFFDGDAIPTNLFYMAEARSGEGKSRAMKMLTRGMAQAIENEKATRAKKRNEILSKFSENNDGKPEKASHQEREILESDLLKKHDVSHKVSDINSASFDAMLKDQQGWFTLKTTEQGLIDGLFLGSHTDGNVNLDPILNAFDGEYTETRRISRQGFSGTPHGGIGIVSQNGLIEKMLDVSGNRGLTQRFFMVLEPTMMGRRNFTLHENNTPNLDEFNNICRAIVENAFREVEVLQFQNLKPLSLCREGWQRIYEYKNIIEPHLGPGGKYEPAILSSMWSKVEIFIMKTAATLWIMDSQHEDKPVSLEFVEEAIVLVDCLFTGVSNIAESKGIVGVSVEERSILDYLSERTKFKGLDAQAIKNAQTRKKVFQEYADNRSKRVMQVLEELVKKGKVQKQNIDGTDYYKFYRF